MAESPFGLHEIEAAGPNGLARKWRYYTRRTHCNIGALR